MSTFFPSRPLACFLHRPLFRIILFIFIFGTFFILFFPSIHLPSLINAPQHYRPLSFDPPQPGSNRHRIKVERPTANRNKDVWAQRADAVRDAFLHAYGSYITYASPYDELLPLSKAPVNVYVIYISHYGLS